MKKSKKNIKQSICFLLFVFFITILDATSYYKINTDSLEKVLEFSQGRARIEILNLLSLGYSDINYSKCSVYAHQAYNLSKKYNDKNNMALALTNIGNSYVMNNDLEKSEQYYIKSLKLFESIGDIEGSAKPINNLGIIYFKKKDFDKSLEYYMKALEIREKSGNTKEIANSLFNLGIYFSNRRDYYQALEYYGKTLSLLQAINDKPGIVECYNEYSRIYKKLGDYNKVIHYSLKSLEVFKDMGDKEEIAQTLNKIGNTYYAIGNYDKALKSLYDALNIVMSINDKKQIAKSLNNIGNVYYDQKNYDSALTYYNRSLEIASEINDDRGMALVLNNLGFVYSDKKEYQKALDYCFQSLYIKESIGDEELISSTLGSIGTIYLQIKDNAKALEYAKKSLDLAIIKNNKERLRDAYELMFKVNEATGNFNTALNYYKQFISVKDSLTSENTRNQITATEIKYQTAAKEKENEALRKDKEQQLRYFVAIIGLVCVIAIILYSRYHTKKRINKMLIDKNIEIERANTDLSLKNNQITVQKEKLEQLNGELTISEEKLREAVTTKDKFFSIIAHDLKNPLQAMILSSYTIANNYHKMDQVKLEDSFNKLHKSANYLAELLENLLQWARTQSGSINFTPDNYDLTAIVNNCVNLLGTNYIRKNITINNHLEPRIGVYADLNMIATVIRNLLTNAIKFTQIGGEINIFTRDTGDLIEVTVADNGMGIRKDDLSKLFRLDVHHSSLGTSKEKGTGLGLIICKEFIEMNAGAITVSSEYGSGTEFVFTVPKARLNGTPNTSIPKVEIDTIKDSK